MQNYNRYDCFYFISLLSETCRVPGWFGPDCVYKCHCQQTLCDGASGACTEGTRCEDGYTGTSCQYSMFFYPPVPSLYVLSLPFYLSLSLDGSLALWHHLPTPANQYFHFSPHFSFLPSLSCTHRIINKKAVSNVRVKDNINFKA